THTRIPAILLVMVLVTAMLIWSIKATTFATWLALGVLAGVVCVWIVSIAAFVFPDRRPDLYQASPANVKWMGIPVLKIVAPLSFLVMTFLVWETVHYLPLAVLVPEHRWYVPVFVLGPAALGPLAFHVAQ